MSDADDAKRRFSSRVSDYVKYRPSYPQEIVGYLRALGMLPPGAVVADVGSGTGLLAEVFLQAGHGVVGVEPNGEMRAAGEAYLRGYPGFRSVGGSAEATGLLDGSVDVVVAGQAFHWFDREGAKREFRRILKRERGGGVALIWNERLVEATPFLRAYEGLLKEYSLDYSKVDHRQMTDAVIGEFFSPRPFHLAVFANRQVFDFEGVKGRLLSSSYAPAAGHPKHEGMVGELRRIFDLHQEGGTVRFEYETKVYTGLLF